jgi:MoaA/NifB/PqqE/SkfB family radical SAM enzyme
MKKKHIEMAKSEISKLWLNGDDFSFTEISQAKHDARMLLLEMDFSDVCDLHCSYCDRVVDRFNNDNRKQKLTTQDRIQLINDAKKLGVRSVDFPGAGEPLLDNGFWEVIECVHSLGMTPIVFTHGYHLSDDKIDRLYKLGASLVLKYNTRNWDIQDKIVGKKGYAEKIDNIMEKLINKGFVDPIPTRLAIDMVVSKDINNTEEVDGIFRWCRNNNIHIYITSLIPTELSSQNSMVIEKEKAKQLLSRLLEIDMCEYGLSYDPVLPIGGGYRCRKTDIGIFVNMYGEVYECNGLSRFIGHIMANSLKDIWEGQYAQSIRQNQEDGCCLARERFWDGINIDGFENKLQEYCVWKEKYGSDIVVERGLEVVKNPTQYGAKM